MAQLYIARHGETEWNAQGRLAGCRDVRLNEAGLAQARALAGGLGGPISSVYTSPLQRARETAGVVASMHGASVRIVEGFRDMAFGSWEGRTFEEIAASSPGLLKDWRTSPHTTCIPGAETLPQVFDRVWPAYETVMSGLSEENRVLIVAHNAVCRLLVLGALGMPLSQFRRVSQDNGAVNRFDIGPDGTPRVTAVNDTCAVRGRHAA